MSKKNKQQRINIRLFVLLPSRRDDGRENKENWGGRIQSHLRYIYKILEILDSEKLIEILLALEDN